MCPATCPTVKDFCVSVIILVHVPLSKSSHSCSTPRRDTDVVLGLEVGVLVIAVVGWELLEGINGAALEDEVLELRKEWGVVVVDLVAATRRGPVRAVPYGGVERHGLPRVVSPHCLVSYHFSDWDFVHIESV